MREIGWIELISRSLAVGFISFHPRLNPTRPKWVLSQSKNPLYSTLLSSRLWPSLSKSEKASLNSAICSSVNDLAASSFDMVRMDWNELIRKRIWFDEWRLVGWKGKGKRGWSGLAVGVQRNDRNAAFFLKWEYLRTQKTRDNKNGKKRRNNKQQGHKHHKAWSSILISIQNHQICWAWLTPWWEMRKNLKPTKNSN